MLETADALGSSRETTPRQDASTAEEEIDGLVLRRFRADTVEKLPVWVWGEGVLLYVTALAASPRTSDTDEICR